KCPALQRPGPGHPPGLAPRRRGDRRGPMTPTRSRHADQQYRIADIDIRTVCPMPDRIRRPRGSARDVVGLFVKVQPEVKDAFENLADATGASKWALIEAMIAQAEADLAAGRGDWL